MLRLTTKQPSLKHENVRQVWVQTFCCNIVEITKTTVFSIRLAYNLKDLNSDAQIPLKKQTSQNTEANKHSSDLRCP